MLAIILVRRLLTVHTFFMIFIAADNIILKSLLTVFRLWDTPYKSFHCESR